MREIRWTEESEEHIWSRHEVRPEEVEEVLYCRPHWVTSGRDGTEHVYGITNAGRYLLVVLTESLDGLVYVVTARKMEPKEKRTFQRKAR